MPNSNQRIFWACQAVGISTCGSTSYTAVHGLQSVGITTTFNLEQVFELGQIAIYENVENIPDIEVTLEKVIDGYPLIYHLATRGFVADTLTGRSAVKCSVAMSIFGDTQNAASGVAISQAEMSGMYVSSLSYTFPVEGNCTEAVTLVGNNKRWLAEGSTDFEGTIFDNTDEPLALTSGTGGIQRRENVVFETNVITLDANNMIAATDATILPPDIPGIAGSGTNFPNADGDHPAHIQGITVSTDLGRENLNELGRKGPYFRFVTFPVEVTCEIEVLSTTGDQVDALEAAASNITDRSIRIRLEDSTFLNLGTKNKLASVTYGGGDTGGGNVTDSYSYSTFNDLIVTHDQDPLA